MGETFAVFCGASSGTLPVYTEAARRVARWIVGRGATIVYGGGRVGLMGTVAETALAAGGQVVGIMPQNLYDRGASMAHLTALHIVPDMAQRKAAMLARADVCVALPGGPGTLEEISEAFSWARIGDNDAPCILYDAAGYYRPLAKMFDAMVQNGFLTAADRAKLCFSADFATIAAFIRAYTPPAIRHYPPREQ